MNFFYAVSTALENLRANKLRSGLTMLGIIIGVSAVIMMVAILQGASARVTNEFNKLGSDLILVVYAPTQEERKVLTHHIEGLKMQDVAAIKAKCSLLKSLAPEMPIGNAHAKYAGQDTDVNAKGVVPGYDRMRNVQIAQGRFVSEEDLNNWAKVCVIGTKVRDELFHHADPIGKSIEVNGLSLTVVGVLTEKGRTFEGDSDKNVFVPLSTVQKRMLGSEMAGELYAQPIDLEHMNEAKDQVWHVLMARYQNLPGWKVDSFDNMLNSINQILAIFTLVMGSIAGLALLVGGIGIMNIMLVTVTERTREIGIRKAIGAKRRDILIQFLIESATLSGVGGLTGVAVGTGSAYLIHYITTFIPSLVDKQTGQKGIAVFVPIPVVIGSFLFSAGIGIFFGIYPAIRASRLNPIDALRHE